jgi:hypothetical protein
MDSSGVVLQIVMSLTDDSRGITYSRNMVIVQATGHPWLNKGYLFCLPGVNFTNDLRAAFVPKSFRHKITNPNCKHIKAAERTLV